MSMKSFIEKFRAAKGRFPCAFARSPREHPCGSRGITLMELLVVMLILALIAGFAIPMYLKYLTNSQIQAAQIQIRQLSSILDLYRLDVGSYPPEEEGLQALVTQPAGVDRWNGPYMKQGGSLADPWGTPYQYRFPGEHGEFDLFSLGADGQEGGEGENADITSW